jgi:hypothetical protein
VSRFVPHVGVIRQDVCCEAEDDCKDNRICREVDEGMVVLVLEDLGCCASVKHVGKRKMRSRCRLVVCNGEVQHLCPEFIKKSPGIE